MVLCLCLESNSHSSSLWNTPISCTIFLYDQALELLCKLICDEQEASEAGAGSVLMLFLGSVVISFGFDVFTQRSTMMRHCWEIILGIAACSSFSMLSTIALGRLLGMQPEVILALTPRSITVALALPMASALGSKLATVTAGAVVLTGMLLRIHRRDCDYFMECKKPCCSVVRKILPFALQQLPSYCSKESGTPCKRYGRC